jgi:hypothetical protein
LWNIPEGIRKRVWILIDDFLDSRQDFSRGNGGGESSAALYEVLLQAKTREEKVDLQHRDAYKKAKVFLTHERSLEMTQK